MSKHTILILIAIALAAGAYFLFMSEDATAPNTDKASGIQYYDDGQPVVYCDEDGNRYTTTAEAEAAGLTTAQYGATYCPENVSAMTGDYVGLSTTEAETQAQADGVMFRVVEEDGQPLPTTRDFREGRINATVEAGVVTEYSVETSNPVPEESTETNVGNNDAIIGMTTVEAEVYTKANGIDFRTGTVDGVAMPVTMDFRPGRITAETKGGVVIGYSVE